MSVPSDQNLVAGCLLLSSQSGFAKPVSEQVHSSDMCHFITEDLVGIIWRE